MNSKFTKFYQCYLEKSHAVLTEINPEFWSRPSSFLTKTDSYRSTSHKTLQKQNNEDFFIQLLYAWLYCINKNIPPSYLIYKRNSCPTHIFKSKHQVDFKHHPTQEYFRQIDHYLGTFCRFLLPGLISSTIFCKKLVFPTVNHKRYIKLHWAQFPMIVNT